MKALLSPVTAGVVFWLGSLVSAVHADIGYQFVPVGNPGNANDSATSNLYGGVSYLYNIGTYDVTLNQYTTFLNAVAKSDPHGLYYASMGIDANIMGIAQSGSSGSYSYSVIGSGNRPVAYITWFDAARFCNWLQNGQPTGLGEVDGSTEQGAYSLHGATSGIISKNGNAQYWIPTESEWYKAAYYDPSLNAGAGGYWTYATKSNTAPGNVVGSGSNRANYNNGVYSVTQSSYSNLQNYLTDVGAFTDSASTYGTYDQSGNVFEWNDAIYGGSFRGLRGGAWLYDAGFLQSAYHNSNVPTLENSTIGFRVATVPEPTVALSLIVGAGLLVGKRRRTN